ncbi:MFS transporter [Paenibacillus sambharensis]|uniref:MFS transporter n=1 Tax=Paenibacillus sambharensis TaxID=1803190 RepID=A0A2W1LTD2_9BACL|nr:MFS transporter [Paenibacillus sambharensis]PZD97774.1 MFS transporter [Paenibacillus sambharensis]
MNHTAAKLWTRSFTLICWSSFFLFMTFYMLATALPLFVENSLNGSRQEIGLAMTVFVAATVICRPIAGRLAVRIGNRPILLTGLSLFMAASLLYYAIPSLPMLLVLRFVHGIGFGLAATASSTAAALLVPNSRKGEGIGYFSLFMSLAMVIGPFAGLTASEHSFTLFFSLCGLFALLSLASGILAKLPAVNTTRGNLAAADTRWIRSIFEPKAVPIALTALVLAFAYSGITTFLSVYADELGLHKTASWFFVCFALMIVIPRPFTGRLFDRYGASVLIYPGLVSFTAGMVLLSQAHSPFTLLLSGGILGLGYGVLFPSYQTLAIQAAPASTGIAISTFFVLFDSGYGAGSYFLGLLASYVHYSNMYLYSAFLVGISALLYYRASKTALLKGQQPVQPAEA